MISFRCLEKSEFEEYESAIFKILADNMAKIAPTGLSREDDHRMWHEAVGEGFKHEARKIVLILDGDELIGFFQYYTNDSLFMMEEIQFIPDYHGKDDVFRKLYGFLIENLPQDIMYVEAYANKRNEKSIGILTRLGLKIIGENKNKISYHFRGEYGDLLRWFNGK